MVIVGVLALAFVLFFSWMSYTSPVNEAGREYQSHVKSYQNKEVETMDDVYERLRVLEDHFNSTTFHKVQGGEKREVTFTDIETLFEEPDQIIQDVEMSSANTVYQYHYDEITVNFHEHFRTIEEYVIEDFTETLYDAPALDRLFIDAIIEHQTQNTKVNEEFEPIMEENALQLVEDNLPTRKIHQSGWFTWSLNPQYYFDDGGGDYGPTEYLSLEFEKENEDTTQLSIMERRYNKPFEEIDTPEEIQQKEEALFNIIEFFEEQEADPSEEILRMQDFSNEFGEVARTYYNFQDGTLAVSWLINDAESAEEMLAIVPITDVANISDMEDLADLEVVDYYTQVLYDSERFLNTSHFIGSK